jgi:hypothetical protein
VGRKQATFFPAFRLRLIFGGQPYGEILISGGQRFGENF